MAKIKIILDSCGDLPKEIRDKYDIDTAPLTLIWNEKEIEADSDWQSYTPQELYGAIANNESVKSNQVTAALFEEKFNKYIDEGYDVLYVALTPMLSGSYTTGCLVAKNIMEKRPGAKIMCLDSKISGGGEGLVAIEAAKAAAQGLELEEVYAKAEERAACVHQYATVGDLKYLKRAGRIKASAAFFGNLFGIKPMITNDVKGNNVAVSKVRGKKAALDMCVKMLKDEICYDDNPYPVSEQTIAITNAVAEEDAKYLEDKIKAEIQPKDTFISYINPAVGASVGPGTVIIFGFGKKGTLGA